MILTNLFIIEIINNDCSYVIQLINNLKNKKYNQIFNNIIIFNTINDIPNILVDKFDRIYKNKSTNSIYHIIRMTDITSVGGYRKGYTLEVQRYDGIMWKHDPSVGKFFHIGYMKALFPNKRVACKYYDKWNDHLRPINFHGTYCSAVDPENKLRYVVRKYHGETQTQNPFCLTDLEIICGNCLNGD